MTNHTHIATLLQAGFYTIGVIFMEDRAPEAERKLYTYKIPNRIQVKEGDFAIVKVDEAYKIVKIKQIHDEPQVDLSRKYPYKWIVQPLNTEAYDDIVSLEKSIEQQFFKQQQKAARAKYLENLGLGEGLLPIVNEAQALFKQALGANPDDSQK